MNPHDRGKYVLLNGQSSNRDLFLFVSIEILISCILQLFMYA